MSPTMKHFTEANCKFAVDFIKEQIKDRSGQNYVSCPIGAELSLALFFLGSGGKTADEIKKVLHLSEWTETVTSTDDSLSGSVCDKPGGFHDRFKCLLSIINQDSKHNLEVHSRLYGSNNYDFKKQYIQCIKELYKSELEKVDFRNATEEARQKMNSWVERHTDGKILNVFPVNSIDRSTILVLLNTVTFKGSWKMPFDPKDTYKGVFWTFQDRSIYVDMMTRRGRFNVAFISNPAMQVLEIPYDNEEMNMLLFLPGNNVTPDEIITNLTHEKIQEWIRSENMRNVEIKISIPMFTLQNQYPLKYLFSNMGVNDLFIPGKANLSGMTGNKELVVSEISQAVMFSISEEGAEGAGAARTEVVSGSHPDIKVDKPFFFVVILKATGCILFFGRICVPE